MSLLRQAELCIVNQTAYKALNAFISLPKSYTQLNEGVQRAYERQREGEIIKRRYILGYPKVPFVNNSKGVAKSSLDGQLIAIKDNICTVDYPTTCASKILKKFRSPNVATIIDKLESAGAIIAGKTNLDEFGMGYDFKQGYRRTM